MSAKAPPPPGAVVIDLLDDDDSGGGSEGGGPAPVDLGPAPSPVSLSGGAGAGRKRRRVVVDLTGDGEAASTSPGTPAARPPAPPRWAALTGTRRVVAELQALQNSVQNSPSGGADIGVARVRGLEADEADVHRWRLRLDSFDEGTAAGRDLARDLAGGGITLEVRFPPGRAYPREPPFVRVVRPRMRLYTGHVTAGGAVCIRVLADGWRGEYGIEGILGIVAANFLDCERVYVRTATGPGGESGPLRVDPHQRGRDYSEAEARAAFGRMVAHHRRNGW